MVGKIMKHDLRALFRGLLYVGIACVLLAVIGRILVAADGEGAIGIIFSVLAVYISIIMIFAAYIMSVANFSRSLYSGEGYLTFSLPVTVDQLLIGKILSALVSMLFGVAVAVVSTTIVLSGVPSGAWDTIGEMFGEIFSAAHAYLASDPLLIVEIILYVLASLPMGLLVLYLLCSLGQLFNKHRKLFTIGLGLLLFIVVLPILSEYCFDPILNAAGKVSVHFPMWLQILAFIGIDVGSYFLVRYILKHKLNLMG